MSFSTSVGKYYLILGYVVYRSIVLNRKGDLHSLKLFPSILWIQMNPSITDIDSAFHYRILYYPDTNTLFWVVSLILKVSWKREI